MLPNIKFTASVKHTRQESGKEIILRKFSKVFISQKIVKLRPSGLAQIAFPGLSTNDF